MKKTKKVFGVVCALSLMLVLGGCQGGKGEEDALKSTVFKTMESVDLKGDKIDAQEFGKNKLTVVNAWNVGCTPCIEELPILDELNQELADKGVSILGLYLASDIEINDEERQEVEGILAEANASYRQIIPNKEMLNTQPLNNISAFPTTYFVNNKGEIIDFIEGSSNYDGWKSLIEEKLQEVN